MLTAATKTTEPMTKLATAPTPKFPFPCKPIVPRNWLVGLLSRFPSDTGTVLLVDLDESALLVVLGDENGAELVKFMGDNEGLKMSLASVGEDEFSFTIVGTIVDGMEKLMEKLILLPKPPSTDSFKLNTEYQEGQSQCVSNDL